MIVALDSLNPIFDKESDHFKFHIELEFQHSKVTK